MHDPAISLNPSLPATSPRAVGYGAENVTAPAVSVDDVAAPAITPADIATDPILAYFRYDHLPPALARVSQVYALAAASTIRLVPRSAERTVALRKLLEAKDAAVRAAL